MSGAIAVVWSREVKGGKDHIPSTFCLADSFPARCIKNSPFQPSDWRGLRLPFRVYPLGVISLIHAKPASLLRIIVP
jgi:hypothetical protein